MKKTVLFATIIAGSIALSACGKKEEAPAPADTATADAMGGASDAATPAASEDASAASSEAK